ncbi:PREDICTED: uncharacterized protein LOC104827465 [Tarenaya hassleriana]|uniref:uncharacterized protein LOC104827465 n=1 Tax=Tarenaya hassleriana TaxID=28532 RepID=UPI00053C8E31|nr:PREDICTED: uncharacterized protein LOC104827465 [Tarenaya hassleriana]
MAGLHKFKLFAAAHCGLEAAASVAGSPVLSPTKSPVFHLRRRKTLRMLFDRTSDDRGRDLRKILDESPESDRKSEKSKREINRRRRKLKELMVTSASPPFEDREKRCGDEEERREMFGAPASSGVEVVTGRTGSIRGFRKGAWKGKIMKMKARRQQHMLHAKRN